MSSREQFEKWAINQCIYDLAYSDATKQSYRSMKTKAAWKIWQASRQALEIALPVLEQQEKGDDGWVEWCGGECAPVTGIVEVRWSTGSTDIGHSGVWRWEYSKFMTNIIAYRVIENDGREG